MNRPNRTDNFISNMIECFLGMIIVFFILSHFVLFLKIWAALIILFLLVSFGWGVFDRIRIWFYK